MKLKKVKGRFQKLESIVGQRMRIPKIKVKRLTFRIRREENK